MRDLIETQHDPPSCRVCAEETDLVGLVWGRFSHRDYRLGRCPACGYAFIVDPWLDYPRIYDGRYYAGRGADPTVDYHFELEHPERSIRRYEWEGIARVVGDLLGGDDATRRWLDFGCGNGGLVRHLRERRQAQAFGFEDGAIAADARDRGIPILASGDLAGQAGTFDVVTAIEVIEHTLDPVAELTKIRRMLRRGGLLFLTTGNAQPYSDRLTRWRYVRPEVHISFFEPRSLELALVNAGFRPERRALGAGFDEILKFKVLKNLHVRRRSRLSDALPSRLIAVLADRRTRLSDHPVGWAS
jgi:SAM-dependent methyltransferase